MTYGEAILELPDGTRLHTWRRERTDALARVVIVHGFGEHSGRYEALSEFLLERGFSVGSYDHRGHGRSSGLAGHVDRFADYEDDLSRVIAQMTGGNRGQVFLVAHSMGGLVALRYLARGSSGIAGAVISAPLLGLAVKVPKIKRAIGRASAMLAPRLRMANEVDPSVLSRDPEVGRAYADDPLVHRVVSARWFSEAARAMQELPVAAPRIKAPILIMHGTDDRLASVDATRRAFQLIGSSDKQLIVYPGYFHELFNEPQRLEVFGKVGDWLGARCEAAASMAGSEGS